MQNGFAKQINSPWSSPCVLLLKAGGSFHFCTNFRKVNSVRNSCKTHQQLMSIILDEVPNCTIYLDDVVIHSSTWAEHMLTLHEVFRSLSSASLTLNLTKCEFA